MKIEPKKNPYGFYSFVAFIVIGYVIALITPSHDYGFSWLWVLLVSALFSCGLALSVLGLKHNRTTIGKVFYVILSLFYIFWLIVVCWYIVKHIF